MPGQPADSLESLSGHLPAHVQAHLLPEEVDAPQRRDIPLLAVLGPTQVTADQVPVAAQAAQQVVGSGLGEDLMGQQIPGAGEGLQTDPQYKESLFHEEPLPWVQQIGIRH